MVAVGGHSSSWPCPPARRQQAASPRICYFQRLTEAMRRIRLVSGPPMRPRPGLRRLARSVPFLFVTVLAAGSALSACAGGAGTAAPAGTTSSGATASPSSTGGAGSPPVIVAVTTTGALVTLNPASGVVTRKLVPAGVLGGEISVSATGMVYFARENGCSSKIEATPLSGGSAAVIASGSVPDVSPNGSKLAYADQPSLTAGCAPFKWRVKPDAA